MRTEGRIKKDHRVLVLLVVCIAISLFHLAGIIRPDWEKRANRQSEAPFFDIVWLKGGNIKEGLYQLPVTEFTVPAESTFSPLSAIPAKAAPFFFLPIPINEADSKLLTIIPGIGPSLAGRIIAFRKKKNRIENLNELLKVRGIGKIKFGTLCRYVTI